MPLLPNVLQKGLLEISRSHPKSASDAAAKMAKAYADYARGALAAGVPATFTGTEEKRLRVALESAFAGGNGTPATGAQGWAAGLTSFWLSPPVIFGPGAVVSAIPPFSISVVGALSAIAAPSKAVEPPVAQVAQGLDIATRSVMVFIPPGPNPVPIS